MSSEIAHLRQQLRLQHEAAERGLSELASGTARHDFIGVHMTRGGGHILQLFREGKYEEALTLMELPDWGEEGEQSLKYE